MLLYIHLLGSRALSRNYIKTIDLNDIWYIFMLVVILASQNTNYVKFLLLKISTYG